MKPLYFLLAAFILSYCTTNSQNTKQKTELNTNMITTTSTFYDLNILTLDEQDTIRMSDFKGKKILIVNVASRCGFTPQYAGLQKLHEKYGDNLQIIGFPCNQFLKQESGSKEEIAEFCSKNYGVTFPITTKISVKGSEQHPIYSWLTTKDKNQLGDFKVSWNFNKFLIDESGNLVSHFDSKVKPFDKALI
ncbi:MAG: glutathione peroxidase, partial [Bacteroidia bacterium]|nr:glutathione peroxidase [Bacteroidia bacterium]